MKTRTVAVAASALAAVVALSACGNATKTAATSTASASAVASSTTSAPANPAHNDADVWFTQHMIPHHQQAIEMSDTILAKQGIDPRVVTLANQIKAAQGPEIQQMQGWLRLWGAPEMPMTPGDMGNMPGMPGMPGHDDMPGMGMGSGMMSPADMTALQNAQGVAASKLFLTQMVSHHQGAITMSQKEITTGQDQAVIALAKSITESQRKEIDQMNAILATM